MRMIFAMFGILALVQAAPMAVPFVDQERFSGVWHEIARLPNRYQESCVTSSVEYQLQSQDRYHVFNRCKDTKGDDIEYKGTAKPHQGENFSELAMTYYFFFTREYRIIYLDSTYETAIMTDPQWEQLWIMHRKPTLEAQKLDELLALIQPYVPLEKLIFTPTQGITR